MKKAQLILSILLVVSLSLGKLAAQDPEAKLVMTFDTEDSVRMCKVAVTSADTAVAEVEVKLYVKRLFSLLPVGSATATDEDGVASFEFPDNIPADLDGKLTVIAKIEDDENFGNAEIQSQIGWGIPRKDSGEMGRSLSSSRANAPIYFIVVSNLIIIGIWGTLIYVILQVFKIKKLGVAHKKNQNK